MHCFKHVDFKLNLFYNCETHTHTHTHTHTLDPAQIQTHIVAIMLAIPFLDNKDKSTSPILGKENGLCPFRVPIPVLNAFFGEGYSRGVVGTTRWHKSLGS